MLQKKSSVSGMLRGLIFVPLTVAMLFVFACNEEDEGDSNKINQSGKEINESESKTNKKETSSDKENENENEKTFVRVENMPEFQGGGINKFRNYIQKNLEYPEEAVKNGVEETLYVKFVVEKNGETSNVEVIRGENESLKNEVKRAVNNAPDWAPGTQRGEKVRVQFNMPVVFKLD